MEEETKKFVQPIALSWTYRNRLVDASTIAIRSKHFSPDSIDIGKTFSNFLENKQVIKDDEKSFMRLIEKPKFKKRVWIDLGKKAQLCIGLNCRFLVRFPETFPDYNLLRDTFKEIQENAGIEKNYVFIGINETFVVIDNYLKSLNEDYVLVLDMAMEYETFRQLMKKYIGKCEIVLLYRNWKKYKKNFKLAITTSNQYPDKLHMAFVPIDMNSYGDKQIFSTVLIASGFNSVSLIDTEFKPYIKIKRGNKPKNMREKLDFAVWVDEILMEYENRHNNACSCCDNQDIGELARRIGINGVKVLATHHALEVLSKEYIKAKTNSTARNNLLKLDSVTSMLATLEAY